MIINIPRKFKRILIIICYCLLFINFGSFALSQSLSLRISEPVDSVIADLKSYIPYRMSEADVPGLAITIIRDNKIVWSEGFGVANRLIRQPIESGTVFEVASISKVITSYIALRLINQGTLSFDEPVKQYLNDPWLPSSEYSDNMTIRHLLSHSSGLGDDILFMNKDINFKPGSEFLYSGVGFLYLQEIIEHVTNESLEEIADQLVFQPLGMGNSSFINQSRMITQMANGHMRYVLLLLSFLIPFCSIFFVIIMITKIVYRIIVGAWKFPKVLFISIAVISFVLTLILLFSIMGTAFPNLVWMSYICFLIFIIVMSISYFAINFLLRYFNLSKQKRKLRVAISTILMIIVFIFFVKLTSVINGPVFKNHSNLMSSNGSLRSTAPDLATFLIEFANPCYLSENIAVQIDSAQISINNDFSWGLGIGIQHSPNGNALWQNGISFAYRSVMVIYPKMGHGVVVLTNSESGLQVAYDVAERALGGKAQWKSF
ncbi:MAG: serine hydrolase [Candidatus Lokiarchaeota archaeon]|nr:serine hydrolase [Candidatus Lokiarchaeota archaeon]